jgi:hypothetical protein
MRKKCKKVRIEGFIEMTGICSTTSLGKARSPRARSPRPHTLAKVGATNAEAIGRNRSRILSEVSMCCTLIYLLPAW